ncbi:MAG: shikimate dehydrogenase [Chloroflexota bacterium]
MKRLFLLGQPIAHSLSPAMHNAALAVLGLDWRYDLLEINAAGLPAAVARLRADDCLGANVTIPHKETIIPLLDGLGESAREIGAVNTVVKRDGRLLGENTDAVGFARSLADAGCEPRGARAALLGAGGAARAVGFALCRAGVRALTIANRTPARAQALAGDLARQYPAVALLVNEPAEVELLVSSLPQEAPLDLSPYRLADGAVAYDLGYRSSETNFLRQAALAGARPLNGLGMLVYQAAAALEYWTDRAAPVPVMFAAARRELERG